MADQLPSPAAGDVQEEARKTIWKIYPQRWYQTYPYKFEINFQDEESGRQLLMLPFFLPCPPSSLTIQDQPTSNAFATFGGVVEETSAPVFTTCILTGTTGMALNDQTGMGDPTQVSQRKSFYDATGGTNVIARLGQAAVGMVEGLAQGITGNAETELPFGNYPSAVYTPKPDKDGVEELNSAEISLGSAASLGSKILDALTKWIPGQADDITPTAFTNGFSWAIALRQFFLRYCYLKEKYPAYVSLSFLDFKRNTQSRCVMRAPQFQVVAAQPYITTYSLYLKLWDTRDIEEQMSAPVDRLKTDLKNVETLNASSAILSFAKTIKKLRHPLDLAGGMASGAVASKLEG